MNVTREQIVAEARTWLGTPWHHDAAIKGAGVDCAQFLRRVYIDAGAVPAFEVEHYPMQWYLHQGQPLFLEWVAKFGHKVDVALPGDVLMFNFGRHAAHGAIVLDEHYMIHAQRVARKVIISSRDSLTHRLDSSWSMF